VGEDEQRVAVITGGSRGIGAGLVDAYRQAGWAVVANALTIRPSTDADILAVSGDVAESSVCDRIVKGAVDRFGRIDTLVNNAGVYRSKTFTRYTEQDYAEMVAVNLTGFFRLTQRVVPVMLSQKGGHIVNITTTLADYASSDVPSVLVSMTKGGLASATRALAIEFANRGIRVNAVSPGIIATSMDPGETYDESVHLEPIGRVGTISEIVNGILFLESAHFITGEILHIDGGQIAGH
jgi:NAD(P)-dependent dehydrogenase (short-subunit alcohol dehydrogenase family)